MLRTVTVAAILILSGPALAVDGAIEISHAGALAGGITPSDTPGYPVTLDFGKLYRLTSNLQPPDVTAIVITASLITVDLNGFTIFGPNQCSWNGTTTVCTTASTFGMRGITSLAGAYGITVRNGSIHGMSSFGLHLGNNSIVDNVRVMQAGWDGIFVGVGSVIRDSSVDLVAHDGIHVDGSMIRGSIITHVGTSGIFDPTPNTFPSIVSGSTIFGFKDACTLSVQISDSDTSVCN